MNTAAILAIKLAPAVTPDTTLRAVLANTKATLRIIGLIIASLVLVALYATLYLLSPKQASRVPPYWHKTVCRIVGLQIKVHGNINTKIPTLYTANHTTYIDIPVLGTVLKGRFVAKKEVESWPVIGFLAKCQNTVFIERNPRKAKSQQEIMANILRHNNLILFPEGTTGDGTRILPFKSTLFSVAKMLPEDETLYVQPVTIVYTGIDGLPLRRVHRPLVSWYGDMALGPHLWQFLKQGKIVAEVTAHSSVTRNAFANRKELAAYCEAEVHKGLASSYTKSINVLNTAVNH